MYQPLLKIKRVMKPGKFILIISIFCFCSAYQSGTAQTLSLQSCIDYGLVNNYNIKITRNDEAITANNNSWANAGGLGSINLTAGYSGNIYGNNTESRETGQTTKMRNIADNTLNTAIRAELTVFDGFKIQTTKKKLEEFQNIGSIKTRITIEDFVAELSSNYYNYVRQFIRMKNLNYAVSLSRERLRIVQERYSIGENSQLDLKLAQVDFNADSAKSLKQNELLTSAGIKIKRLMSNNDLSTPFIAADSIISLIQPLNYDSLLMYMLENNSELLRAHSGTTMANLDLKSVQSRVYPYLKLNTGYGYTHNIYGATSTIRRGHWGSDFGATVGINLIDGKKRTEIKNARIEAKNAEIALDELELSLRVTLADLWQAYNNNIQLVKLEKENLETAQKNYDIAYDRYLLGELSGFQIREVQKSLLDAGESLLIAEYDTKICEISLLQISGIIIQFIEVI